MEYAQSTLPLETHWLQERWCSDGGPRFTRVMTVRDPIIRLQALEAGAAKYQFKRRCSVSLV